MPQFEWKRAYETGNATIDAQHKQLLALANLLIDAVEKGRDSAVVKQAFDALMLYTHEHFDDEERYFVSIGSSLWQQHRQQHRRLANEVRKMWTLQSSGNGGDMGATLEDWVENRLVRHMMEADQDALRAVR